MRHPSRVLFRSHRPPRTRGPFGDRHSSSSPLIPTGNSSELPVADRGPDVPSSRPLLVVPPHRIHQLHQARRRHCHAIERRAARHGGTRKQPDQYIRSHSCLSPCIDPGNGQHRSPEMRLARYPRLACLWRRCPIRTAALSPPVAETSPPQSVTHAGKSCAS